MNVELNPKLNLIYGRRSVRTYSPGAISEETVTQLLAAAMAAPSAMAKDPWRFVVIRKPETLAALGAACPGGGMVPAATLAIAVCGDLEAAFQGHLSYLLQDCSASIQNLLLAAHGLGLGACWVGVHPLDSAVARVKEILGLPGPVVPVAVIALGLPGEQLETRTRHNPAYIREETW